MSSKNLVDSILGNNRREERRGGRDYEESDYNSGRAAINFEGISLLSVTLVETGTYDPEYLRPYVVSANRDDINRFADVVDEEHGKVGIASVAGLAGRIMHYSNRVDQRDLIDIENGWNEKRFSYIIEVVESQMDENDIFNPDKELVTLISGYTDRMDVAAPTSVNRGRRDVDLFIAGDTEFFVTNVRRIERTRRRIKTDNQLIVPSYYNNSYRNNQRDLFTVRPKDVFTNENVNNIIDRNSRDNDIMRIVNNNKLTGSQARPSRSVNLAPASYLATSVNALYSSSVRNHQRDHFGGLTEDISRSEHVYRDAKAAIKEDTGYEPNSFLYMLRKKTNFLKDSIFTWSELGSLFGRRELEDITKIYGSSPIQTDDNRQARAGDGAGWDNNENSGRNAVFATVLKQTLPGYALESMIYVCRIQASNILSRTQEMDAVGGALVTVSNVVFAAKLSQREQEDLIRQFEENIALHILRDLSLDNAIDYDIVVELDWRFDSFIEVSIENGRWLEFPVGGFANSLSSPIVTSSQQTTELIGGELKSIINNILDGR